jgi:hypothetical protein
MSKFHIFPLLLSFVQAYSEFLTTCTTPPSRTNYVSSPDTRGTLDIIWSCFFTIIACTWTIQHLNVPEQSSHDSQGTRWYQFWRWDLRGPRRSLKWMFVTIIAPEYILGKALADLSAARQSKKQIRQFLNDDGAEWGLTHAFFANMGGFVLTQTCNEMPDSQQDLRQAVANGHEEITIRQLGNSGIMDRHDDPHKFASATIAEFDAASSERRLALSPEESSKKMFTKPEDEPPRSSVAQRAPASWTYNKSAIFARRILPKMATRTRVAPDKRDAGGAVSSLGGGIWKSTILREDGGILSLNLYYSASELLKFILQFR